jgi:hypothetical protein
MTAIGHYRESAHQGLEPGGFGGAVAARLKLYPVTKLVEVGEPRQVGINQKQLQSGMRLDGPGTMKMAP